MTLDELNMTEAERIFSAALEEAVLHLHDMANILDEAGYPQPAKRVKAQALKANLALWVGISHLNLPEDVEAHLLQKIKELDEEAQKLTTK